MMDSIVTIITSLLLILAMIPGGSISSHPADTASAYVDPALNGSEASTLNIIVTATDSQVAGEAVAQVGGEITSDLWLIDAVGAKIPSVALDRLAQEPGIESIVENKGVQASDWGGWTQTFSGWVTDQAWPVVEDVGADILHGTTLPDGRQIKGDGVTIAVLDSGVFYSPFLMAVTNQDVAMNFIGQADFVGEGLCRHQYPQDSWLTWQGTGYCKEYWSASIDGYGHGTHVSGIIGNQYRDMATDKYLGIAPHANILGIRILDKDGKGNYIDAIEGIQYAVDHKDDYGIRILNMSLSASATVPYFVDPLNRAVESAWAAGLVVVAAAGNEGPAAETITVPGNDPYVITVGAVDTNRTPGDWSDDILPAWSATGPTLDGFVKPDVLAPGGKIVSFMFNDPAELDLSAALALIHPDYSQTASLFRMSGTSMATAVTSGVVALMLQANPELTPDEVKFRLMQSARPAATGDQLAHNILQQGAGRIWAPDAVLGDFAPGSRANLGMDIQSDLAHGFTSDAELAFHYQGPVQKILSDDGSTYLYQIQAQDGNVYSMGASRASDMSWVDWNTLSSGIATWSGGSLTLDNGINWAGGMSSPAGIATWSGGIATWSGGIATWSGGIATWSGGIATWSGGIATWSGGIATWSGGIATWSGGIDLASASVSATKWVGDDLPPTVPVAQDVPQTVDIQAPTSMYIADIEGVAYFVNDRWQADFTIFILDNNRMPVAGATVSGVWPYDESVSCVTGSDGRCTVTSKRLRSKRERIKFTVEDVSHPTISYNPSDNAVNSQLRVLRPQ